MSLSGVCGLAQVYSHHLQLILKKNEMNLIGLEIHALCFQPGMLGGFLVCGRGETAVTENTVQYPCSVYLWLLTLPTHTV